MAGLAVGSVASVAAVSSAVAVVSNAFTYSPVQYGYYPISALGMSPDSNDSADAYFTSYNDGTIISNGATCFNTGLNLPNGAVVRRLVVWYSSDGGAGEEPNVRLRRYALSDGSHQDIVPTTDLTDNSDARVAIAFNVSSNAIINNATHAYGLGVCLDDGGRFFEARVDYTFTSAGD
jgi:hypothetical protein